MFTAPVWVFLFILLNLIKMYNFIYKINLFLNLEFEQCTAQ